MTEYGISIGKDTSECRSQWTEAVAEEGGMKRRRQVMMMSRKAKNPGKLQ